MRLQLLLLGLAVAFPAYGQIAPEHSKSATDTMAARPEALTLDRAWALAETANPTLRSARALVLAVEGQLRDTRGLLWNNPQFATDLTRRHASAAAAATQSYPEWTAGIAQTFEIAGQHGHRRRAAQLEAAAVEENIEEVRRQVRGDVELSFTRVLALQRRIDLEQEAIKTIEDSAAAVRKRVGAGEDSRLEGNLAAVEAERARNQLAILREELLQARADLAAVLQLPPASFPDVVGEFTVAPPAYSLDTLLASAASRPQWRALALREDAARSRLALERASAYPDVTVGLATGREGALDARERPTILSVSVPLPLFRRNATGIGRAASELTQAQIDREVFQRDTDARVRALWQRLQSLRERVSRLSESVLPTLAENQRLSSTAFRAGEIGLLQLLLVNRQLLDARRDYLDAFGQFVEARIALEQAAGITGSGRGPDSQQLTAPNGEKR